MIAILEIVGPPAKPEPEPVDIEDAAGGRW
jgi:hypothetical protein